MILGIYATTDKRTHFGVRNPRCAFAATFQSGQRNGHPTIVRLVSGWLSFIIVPTVDTQTSVQSPETLRALDVSLVTTDTRKIRVKYHIQTPPPKERTACLWRHGQYVCIGTWPPALRSNLVDVCHSILGVVTIDSRVRLGINRRCPPFL